MMSMGITGIVSLMLTVFATVLALAVTAELMARLYLRRSAYYVWQPGYRMVHHPSPEVFPELERCVRLEINSWGERGGEPPKRDTGLYRVLVVGGSAVEGYFLDQASAWPAVLEKMLMRPDRLAKLDARTVHVGVVARAGVDSASLDVILARILPRYPKLDAVIIMLGGSDVYHWIEEGMPSTLPPRVIEPSEVFAVHPEIDFGLSLRRLGLVEVARRARWSWLGATDTHEGAGRWIGRAREMRRAAPNVIREAPDPKPVLDYYEKNFRSIIERCRLVTDRIIMARQPWFRKAEYSPEDLVKIWEGGLGKAWREEITTYCSPEVVTSIWADLDRHVASLAEELAIEQVDISAYLPPALEHYYDMAHFTPAGAKIVAEAVAEAILEKPEARLHRVSSPVLITEASD